METSKFTITFGDRKVLAWNMPPFISAWVIMLISGAFGHVAHNPKFFIGYWPTFFVIWGLRLLIYAIVHFEHEL